MTSRPPVRMGLEDPPTGPPDEARGQRRTTPLLEAAVRTRSFRRAMFVRRGRGRARPGGPAGRCRTPRAPQLPTPHQHRAPEISATTSSGALRSSSSGPGVVVDVELEEARGWCCGPRPRTRCCGPGTVHDTGCTRPNRSRTGPGGVVAGAVPDGDLGGELGDRLVEDRLVIRDVVGRGVTGPQDRGEPSPVASATGGTRPAWCGAACSLFSEWISTQRRVDVEHHRVSAGPRGRRAHTLAPPRRPPPPTRRRPRRGGGNVRHRVVSEHTPVSSGRSPPAARVSMSAQDSPPPASISPAWTSTLPRSCAKARSPRHGTAPDRQSPSPIRSANDAMSANPT